MIQYDVGNIQKKYCNSRVLFVDCIYPGAFSEDSIGKGFN